MYNFARPAHHKVEVETWLAASSFKSKLRLPSA